MHGLAVDGKNLMGSKNGNPYTRSALAPDNIEATH